MRFLKLAAATGAAIGGLVLSAAYAGTLIPVPPVPNSVETDVLGINDNDVITGAYFLEDGSKHGFVGTLDGEYSTFDYGSGFDTTGIGIDNNGYVTGWAYNEHEGTERQFIRNPDGKMRNITLNGAALDGSGRPGNVIGKERFVGWYEVAGDKPRGYFGKHRDYREEITLPFENGYGTLPSGLNRHGDVVGAFTACDSCSFSGFVIKDGIATEVDYPDQEASATKLAAINDKGEVVGSREYCNDGDCYWSAFIYNSQSGTFKNIPADAASSINNAGLVAVQSNGQPYIFCSKPKKSCPNGR
jgi:hypothetical protein